MREGSDDANSVESSMCYALKRWTLVCIRRKGSTSTKPNIITARGVGKFVSLTSYRRYPVKGLTSLNLNNSNSPYKAILDAIPRNR